MITTGPQIVNPPSGLHSTIAQNNRPSDHDIVISGDVLSWNILTQCNDKPNNNGFNIKENDPQYKNRLTWIAESIAETLAANPNIKIICLQEVPNDDAHLKFFHNALVTAIQAKNTPTNNLQARFPIESNKNSFFHQTGPNYPAKNKQKYPNGRPPSHGRLTFFDTQEFSKCYDRTQALDPGQPSAQQQRISAFELHPKNPSNKPRGIAQVHLASCKAADKQCPIERNQLITATVQAGYDMTGDFNVPMPAILNTLGTDIDQAHSISGNKIINYNNPGEQIDAIIRSSKRYTPTFQPPAPPKPSSTPTPAGSASSSPAPPSLSASLAAQEAALLGKKQSPSSPTLTPSMGQTGSRASTSLTPTPVPGSPDDPLTFTGGPGVVQSTDPADATLEKKMQADRAQALWSYIKGKGGSKKGIVADAAFKIANMVISGPAGLAADWGSDASSSDFLLRVQSRLKQRSSTSEDIGMIKDPSAWKRIKNNVAGVDSRTITEGSRFLRENKVDITFLNGKVTLEARPDNGEGTPPHVVLVATAQEVAIKEYQLLVEEKLKATYGDKLSSMSLEEQQKAATDIEASIPQEDKDQIFSFNISSCRSVKHLALLLQEMSHGNPKLTAKLSKEVVDFVQSKGGLNNPELNGSERKALEEQLIAQGLMKPKHKPEPEAERKRREDGGKESPAEDPDKTTPGARYTPL